MQNSMMLFTFFVFDRKYPFWANLVQNVKIISLSWKLVSRLIRIWIIQWWCSLFLFLTGNSLLGANFFEKVKIVSLKSDSHLPNKMCFLLHWKPFKYEKNAFYFILKALFFLKVFKFLSWLFGQVEKTAWSER